MFSNICRAMTDDDNDIFNPSRAQIANAAFDHRSITEGKQRFEDAHAQRASGGEENCGHVSHAEKITTKTRRHKGTAGRTLCLPVFVVIRFLVLSKLVMYIPASSACAS